MLQVMPDVNMLDLDFDHVLGVLQGWLGEEVRVGVSVTVQPLEVARMNGVLGVGSDMQNPYDADEWEFSVGESSAFALRRDYFTGANLFPDSGHLIALMQNDFEQPAAPTVEVHVGGPASKCLREMES